MKYQSSEMEKQATFDVARLMVAAARTAPKGRGIDNIETLILDGEDKSALAETMRTIADETGEEFFIRDAGNVDKSHYIVLIGVHDRPIGSQHCGNCGLGTCARTKELGANCAFNITDLGIACGSAAAVAADNRIDSRIFYSAGKAAIRLGIFPDSVKISYGMPLSVSAKSPFFDRALVRK